MAFNPQIHNGRSIRLKGFDYSIAEYYFVKIGSVFGIVLQKQLPKTVGQIVGSFKSLTTMEYIKLVTDNEAPSCNK
jgi:hypothetical protein